MVAYDPPIEDIKFVLNEVLNVSTFKAISGFEEVDTNLVETIVDQLGDFIGATIAPLNEIGDREGACLVDGAVRAPRGFSAAYQQYAEAGWPSLISEVKDGGQGLPHIFLNILEEMLGGANLAFAMAPLLAPGAYSVITRKASEELRRIFVPNIVSGRWMVAMSLSEPQCGTALGFIRTSAGAQADGTFKLSGTKIFNSWGDHDMAENIVHLVLARLPGAPEGTKGLSLFIVPKFLVNLNGSLGQRNAFSCGSLEKKLGIHGSPTCVTNFDGATGYLVGEPNQGMSNMFILMNSVRLATGVMSIGIADAAYRNALAYTRERLAGRSLTGTRYPDLLGDPIIVHPDIRRMLMSMRAFVEGGRMFCFWIGLNLDLANAHPDSDQRREREALVSLLTPVVKAFLSDKAFESVDMALQCFGGYGFIRDYGAEQYLRDIRMLRLGEGTSGVQALDFTGRKIVQDGGCTLKLYFLQIQESVGDLLELPETSAIGQALQNAVDLAGALSDELLPIWKREPNEMGAASLEYLHLIGYLSLAYMWAKLLLVAYEGLQKFSNNSCFYKNKIKTAEFFFARMLPDIHSLAEKTRAGSVSLMSISDDEFVA